MTPSTVTQFDVTRDAVIERCPALERICPDGLDVAAASCAGLHDSINGRSTDLAGNRPPKYFREQLRGEQPLTGEDLSRLAIQAPVDLVEWLRPVLVAVAHGAPGELLEMLVADVTPVIDERTRHTREQLATIDAVTPKVAEWRRRRAQAQGEDGER